jgi:putative membrane protein
LDDARDPRVYFAAERTLLAWLRTGLTVMGLGFVVARFGMFVRLVAADGPLPMATAESVWLGTALVLLGAACIGGAALQHARFCRSLTPEQFPADYNTLFAVLMAAGLAGIGLLLAGLLLVT